MRVVIQRVISASVISDGVLTGSIGRGLMILLGIEVNDTIEDLEWLSAKIINLRIFNDDQGVMNLSMKDVGADLLLVSQFTLHASTRKGNRPSYIRAARPEEAVPLYDMMKVRLEQELAKKIPSGVFGADMQVSLVNDGPVTIIIDSRLKE
jgi:D-tyrosyl-tRNA(Tyr) deacylase